MLKQQSDVELKIQTYTVLEFYDNFHNYMAGSCHTIIIINMIMPYICQTIGNIFIKCDIKDMKTIFYSPLQIQLKVFLVHASQRDITVQSQKQNYNENQTYIFSLQQ
ncbi:hypothetical protein SS50377_22582 [Spironucleus salmonicida]|uniref:Uncharacterized protein n=1 Tax=Spironucleus salmonicida TaxID=348837 RepID=A0A9P8LVE6_9EUKA|nr:hypothetical protein SS50377_22582 [Spironucleus salmonicida]